MVAAFQPILLHLDQDGDGRVTGEEFQAHAYAAPRFELVDVNGNSMLDADELPELVMSQDPVTFDKPTGSLRTTERPQHTGVQRVRNERALQDLLSFLVEELRSRDSTLTLPDVLQIQAAVATGDITHPESQRILRQLEAAFLEAGIDFPQQLFSWAPPMPADRP